MIKGLLLSFVIAFTVILGNKIVKAQEENFWALPQITRCCSLADALYADEWEYLADGSVKLKITGTGPRNLEWAEKLIGREYIIPKEKVLLIEGLYKDRPNRPIVFVNQLYNDFVYCFIPGVMI